MMTRTELEKAHGTPDEFAAACNRAADQLAITTAECNAAIAKYRREWDEAGKPVVDVVIESDGDSTPRCLMPRPGK
jgi:hypothetical protein